ncbi:MAG: methylmalonyl-CoA mutase family protein [Acidobacteriia bacterium]|nr:methylmalonyl-CoA mutase family protein [Terriglobia bacterium]
MKIAEKGAQKPPTREFTTISGHPVKEIYTAQDLPGFDYLRDLGEPGEFPFTRGVYKNMYRGRLWTMRQFAGFGEAEDTNLRFKYLLKHGQTGLSVAFDYPTLFGYDSDHPESYGEVGRCGVAIDSLADMEALFDGIRLDQVTTSMTTNAPAAVIWAMYLATAEKQGADWKDLAGTIQNDILKEYIAQKTFIYPPRPSMRLITDTMAFGSRFVPRWNTISISGYHIREAGATAIQELAFTLRDGIEYVDYGINAGMKVDEFAPRLSFFFDVHNDFFEEIAKLRAARRIWARTMKDRYHARDTRSLLCRIHCQTAGVSLTAQQPYNNVVRVTLQALAAVLGGTQSLHTNSLDETLALPTEKSVTIALRTQQIIAHESGVPNTIDPLAGSYFVETLTNEMAAAAGSYFDRIDAMGGMVPAIERGYPQREIQESSYQFSKAVDRKEKIIVGVNEFVTEEPPPMDILVIDDAVQQRQCARLKKLRAERNGALVEKNLSELKRAAEGTENLMHPILDCVRSYATLGEISDALRVVFGEYQEPSIF